MYRFLLTEHIHRDGEETLERHGQVVVAPAPDVATVLTLVGECDAVIVRTSGLARSVLEAASRVRVVARHGVGYDNVDVAAATELGIPVVYTPRANVESVAELTLGFMLCLARKIVPASGALADGSAISPNATPSVMAQRLGLTGSDLRGKTLGIIGLGRIGSLVGRMAIAAFEMKVLSYDPHVDAATMVGMRVEKSETMEHLLPQCDFVSLHSPGEPSTTHMINAAALGLMKPSAYLINTARGRIIDEAALTQALVSGRLAGAALDVFDPEPPRADNPLLRLPNVLATPHYSAMTEESLHNMAMMSVEGVLDVLADRRPESLVNPSVWERRRRQTISNSQKDALVG